MGAAPQVIHRDFRRYNSFHSYRLAFGRDVSISVLRVTFDREGANGRNEKSKNNKKKDQASGERAKRVPRRVGKSEVVRKLLRKVEEKLGDDMKPTLGDYIKLVQLQKEM